MAVDAYCGLARVWEDAEAYWLATVTPGGRPHVVPIWGVMVHDELFLETGAPDTIKNRNLAVNPEVAVHLDGINDAIIVRGVGEATKPDRPLGEALAAAFTAKYKGYDPTPDSWDRGGLYRVAPRTILAWLAMPTATRWTFPAADAGAEEST